MDLLQAPGYHLARLLIVRGTGAVYGLAFLVAVTQFRGLLGSRGLTPVPEFLQAVPFRASPSLFHWRYSDRLALGVAWCGVAVALATVAGVTDLAPWLTLPTFGVLWALYLSIVNVGQTWYGFGWESLLLETGVLVAFLGGGTTAPPLPIIILLRWLAFRVEFGAGLIKMRGDPCWRRLTCLRYHHETQPMPNPLSWWFHRLPDSLHRMEVLGNHIAQLVAPWGLFLPQPIAGIAAAVMIVTQLWLVLSGNFAWLNWITILIALSGLDDGFLGHLLPFAPHMVTPAPQWWIVLATVVAAGIVALSVRPARNLLSRHQMMNASFDPLHLVNTYGAFGSITRERNEIIIEGTADDPSREDAVWREYEFKAKPGDPMRRPPQIAPYHLRLDWLMWFAAMSTPYQHPWFFVLIVHLLENNAATVGLLRTNPFPGEPPRAVRALLYHYTYTTRSRRRSTGAWWHRELIDEYLPPIALGTR